MRLPALRRISPRIPGRIPAILSVMTLAVAVAGMAAPPSGAQAIEPSSDGTYRATITRTSHGIPHIVAEDYGSLGFGFGYTTAETSICVLADTVLTARGKRSRWFGPDARYTNHVRLNATNLQVDALVTDLRNRRVVEKLLADPVRGPSEQARALVRGYAAGVNDYLAEIGGADGIDDPACSGARWVEALRPAKPIDLWYGIYLSNLLASTGVFVPEIVGADPPTLEDPGLPELPLPDLPLPQLPLNETAQFSPVPDDVPSAQQLRTRLGKSGATFGSNAIALGSDVTTTGRGMLLGNPHFPWRGRYRFTQVQLTIPGEYNVAGASLIGSPVVNIGWNRNVAWSHTVSTAYRFTPYEFRTVPGSPTTYLTAEGLRELERRTVHVQVRRDDGSVETVTEDLYRTDIGYVVDAPGVLMGWTPLSFFALRDANAEHLRTIDAFLAMSKADSVQELLAAQDAAAGIPWVNTIAADRWGNVLYADHSVVPNVPDELVAKCATPIGHVLFQVAGLPALDGTRAKGACRWRTDYDSARPGIFGPSNLPETVRQDWVMNANDSYWLPNPQERLEGYDRIIGCEQCPRSLRSRMVYRYVLDRLAGTDGMGPGGSMSLEQLKATEYANRIFGAELAREGGDLHEVCVAADGGKACDVLANWDGRSNVDSVGTHIFREFFLRLPDRGVWEVPFDPNHPVSTPRDLNAWNPQVIAAMREALAYLDNKGVPFDASLGSLQVAADEGAPPIPVGGGPGATGNANAVYSRDPGANQEFLYPISYGSSHIQAVAFTDEGVDADTILTYSQSTNTASPFASDQTRLFGQERWVDFPFTPKQIRHDKVRRYTVHN